MIAVATSPCIEVDQLGDIAKLVEAAIQFRREAEENEAHSSPSRWAEADAYAELSGRGWTQKKIADACGTAQSTVSRFIAAAQVYAVPHNRPAFWNAYAEVTGEKKTAHVSHNAGDNEWYTPPEYIEAAVSVMGGIDLDPASNAEANEIVKARQFFTVADDGLSKKWKGRVWMNPPYGSNLIRKFIEKLCHSFDSAEVTEAIVLVNNATETRWFYELGSHASAAVFPIGRVQFWHTDTNKGSTPLQGQAIVYLGVHSDRFVNLFGGFGLAFVPAKAGAA